MSAKAVASTLLIHVCVLYSSAGSLLRAVPSQEEQLVCVWVVSACSVGIDTQCGGLLAWPSRWTVKTAPPIELLSLPPLCLWQQHTCIGMGPLPHQPTSEPGLLHVNSTYWALCTVNGGVTPSPLVHREGSDASTVRSRGPRTDKPTVNTPSAGVAYSTCPHRPQHMQYRRKPC